MSEVKRKRRIKAVIDDRETVGTINGRPQKIGEKSVKYGWFAEYGLKVLDTGETVASYTAAVIEFDDGKVGLLDLDEFEFVI